MKVKLTGVMETLLITLAARRKDALSAEPILGDLLALDISEKIDFDFSKFNCEWKSYYGILSRSKVMDEQVKRFMAAHPTAVIVSLGCGLDSRFFRVDNGQIEWFNVDFPEVITLREKLFPAHGRVHNIGSSVLDEQWPAQVRTKGRPLLIISEGMMMYLREEEIKLLLHLLTASFDHFEAQFDFAHKMWVKRSSKHDTLKKMEAEFLWGVGTGKEVLVFEPSLRFVRMINFTDEMKKHLHGWQKLMTPVFYLFNNRLGIYTYDKLTSR